MLRAGTGRRGPFSGALIAASAFSPLDYAPIAWWDLTDLTAMTAGIGVGDPITDGYNKAGKAYLVDASGTQRPTLAQDANGVYYGSFDGGDDRLATNVDFGAYFSGKTAATVFIVAKVDTAATTRTFYAYGTNAVGGSMYLYSYHGDAAYAGLYGSASAEAGTTGPGLNLNVLTQRYNLAHDLAVLAAIRQRFNGVDQALSVIGTKPSPSTPITPFRNDSFIIGNSGLGGLAGRVYQVIVYDKTLTDEECANVEAYLATKCRV